MDGGWGEWNSWSECSSSCDLGISEAERWCDHPQPINGGHFCGGESKRSVHVYVEVYGSNPGLISSWAFYLVDKKNWEN